MDEGDPALLPEGVKSATKESEQLVLEGIPIRKRMTLLRKQDRERNTALHRAAKHNQNADVINTLLNMLDIKQRMTLLIIQNKNGRTPLHLAARFNENADIVAALLDKLDTKQRMKLLSKMASYTNSTPLHMAAYYNKNADVVTALLDKLDIEQRMTLLSIQNKNGHTPLHLAARYNENADIVAALLDKLDTKQRMKLLSKMASYTNYTPLHLAAYYNRNADIVAALLNKLDTRQRMTLLSMKTYPMKDWDPDCYRIDRDGYSPLHHAARYAKNADIVTAMLENLDAEQRMTLLSRMTRTGDKILHDAANYNKNADIVTALLDKLDAEQIMTLLSRLAWAGDKILHDAAKYNENADVVTALLDKLDAEQIMTLLSRLTWADEDKILHDAANYNKNADVVTALLDKLDTKQRMKLLSRPTSGSYLHSVRRYSMRDIYIPQSQIPSIHMAWCTNHTLLHMAADYDKNADVVTALLDKLDAEHRMTLLSMKDGNRHTPLHHAAMYNKNADVVTALLDKLDIEQRMTLLSMKDGGEYTRQHTPLHLAAYYNRNADIFTALLNKLDTRQRMALLSMKTYPMKNWDPDCYRRDRDGCTPLHHAAKYDKNADVVTAMLENLDAEQRMTLLSGMTRVGDAILHDAAQYNENADIVTALLDKLDAEQIMTMLSMESGARAWYTPLHQAARYNKNADIVTAMLENLDAEQRMTLLSMKARGGDEYTPLHLATRYNNIKVVNSVLLKSLDRKQTMVMLTLQDKHNNTPLHLAARFNKDVYARFQMLLSKVDEQQMIELLLWTNNNGYTPMHYLADRPKEILAGFIDYLTDQTGEVCNGILLWQNEQGKNILHLAAAINHTKFIKKALSSKDIEVLNQALQKRDSDGLIPYYVTKAEETQRLLAWAETQTDCYPLITPPRIVIFYSDEDRSSAQEESDSFAEILPTFSMTPVVKLNPTKEDIYSIIGENREGEVSALIVVIMSHGDSGVVRVRDGDMSINTILKHMNSTQLRNIPKILIIQACQAKVLSPDHYDGASADDAKKLDFAGHGGSETMLDADPKLVAAKPKSEGAAEPKPEVAAARPIHSHQSRPARTHFDMQGQDFIVLSATINNRTAQRNLMIPILAEHLKNAEEDDDLHSVFLKTVSALHKQNPAQVPEYRTTMKYKICLKKIFKREMEYKSSVYLTYAQQFKLYFRS